MNTKRQLLDATDDQSLVKQCEFLEINRSSYYYEPVEYSDEELRIMRELDMIYTTEFEFYGHRKMWKELKARGFDVGRDRTLKYMRILGIKPYYPQSKTTIPNKEHKKYKYLLRDLAINRPNQVWAADITYIRMEKGFCYLVAIIDWHSRCILSYRISNMMDTSFCIDALNEALAKYPTPDIFNTDQGSQFTSTAFTEILLANNIQISMDGKGRASDNIIIERFFRSLKYEDIYRHEYRTIADLKLGVAKYMAKYNHFRLHESLGYITPAFVYGIQNKEVTLRQLLDSTDRSQFLEIAV